MSIKTYKAAGATFMEQPGDGRTWVPGGGVGRLDLVQCRFVCVQSSNDRPDNPDLLLQYAESHFREFTPHPTLAGFVVIPGSVSAIQAWHGLARFEVTYIGSMRFPALPDGFVEGSDWNKLSIGDALQLELDHTINLNYQTFYLTSVYYGAISPDSSSLLYSLCKIAEAGGSAEGSNTMVLDRNEELHRIGPYSVFRHTLIPVDVAGVNRLNVELTIRGDKIEVNAVQANGVSKYLGADESDLGDQSQRTQLVSLRGCSTTDTVISRIAGGVQFEGAGQAPS